MIAAILTLATQTQTVTFTHPCASSSVVLQKLGEQIGTRLEPGGSVNSDFFLVSFTDVPVQDALDKIATTLNATWEEKSGVKYLTRTRAQELNEEREEREIDVKLITDWLAKRPIKDEYTNEYARDLIEKVIPVLQTAENNANFNYKELATISAESPMDRLLTRLLNEIGPATIADLGELGEAQYVFDPSPVQRRLPNGTAMRMFKKENDVHSAAVIATGAADRVGQAMYYSTLISPYAQGYAYGTDRTMLTVSKEMESIRINLDVEGMGRVYASIPASERGENAIPEALRKQEDKYTPSEIEAEMAKAVFNVFDGRGVRTEISEELAKVISDPVTYEPLATFGSKWMVDATKKLGRNVVALLSDDASFASTVMVARNMTSFGQMWDILPQMDKGYKVSLDDKWITLRPAKPVEVRKERVDREKWRSLLVAGRGNESASIETYAAYALLSDNDLLVMLSTVPAILGGQDINIDAFQRDRAIDALRLYGTLTSTQQRAARGDGFELSLQRITPSQARHARRILFEQRASLTPEPAKEKWGQAGMYYAKVAENDPHVRLGGGAPNGSVLRFSVAQNTLLYPRPQEGNGRGTGYTTSNVASFIVSQEFYPDNQYFMDFAFMATGNAEQLVLEFAFPGIGFLYKRVQFDHLPREVVYKRVNELPEGVRNQLQSEIVKLREEYKKARGGGGGG